MAACTDYPLVLDCRADTLPAVIERLLLASFDQAHFLDQEELFEAVNNRLFRLGGRDGCSPRSIAFAASIE
jgi:hypothetical protein